MDTVFDIQKAELRAIVDIAVTAFESHNAITMLGRISIKTNSIKGMRNRISKNEQISLINYFLHFSKQRFCSQADILKSSK